ncbi:MAG: FAD-dependent oxidoreductase [Clostridiales bacterium]|nr:FAD-dependent oxidoreductase [Clostridiales bacterium]
MTEKHQTIIIGGGPAGLTAAIYLCRAGYEVLLFEKEEEGGQIRISEEVVNYPGIEQTDGEALMETMRRQAVNFGADIRRETVLSVSLKNTDKIVQTEKGHYEAPVVIYAAGSVPRKLDFPGEGRFAGRGIAYCATCDGELFKDKPIFVVGGGYAAAEEAMFLTRYSRPVTMIVREPEFTCAKSIADKVKAHPDIQIEFNTEIVRVEGDTTVKKIVLKNSADDKEWSFESEDTIGIFIFAGYLPQTEIVKKQLVCDSQGYLVTDEGKRTNVEGVYGAGDVCQKRLRQVVTAVADGAAAAETIVADYPLEQMSVAISPHSVASGIKDNENELEEQFQTQGDTKNDRSERKEQFQNQKEDWVDGVLRPDSPFKEVYFEIREMERHFATNPHCKVSLDDSDVSKNVRAFMKDLESVMPKARFYYENVAAQQGKIFPSISISSEDGKRQGMYFHGTPGGHEFSSFLSALYQAAGPGKPLSVEVQEQVQGVKTPVRLEVGVTLGCTKCPVLAASAMAIAAITPMVETHLINIAQFPDYKEKHQIFSVPFLLINGDKTFYGKKNAEELIQIILENI